MSADAVAVNPVDHAGRQGAVADEAVAGLGDGPPVVGAVGAGVAGDERVQQGDEGGLVGSGVGVIDAAAGVVGGVVGDRVVDEREGAVVGDGTAGDPEAAGEGGVSHGHGAGVEDGPAVAVGGAMHNEAGV